LSGGEQMAFPIADGEVVFYQEEGRGAHCLPRGNGSFIVLQHEGGILSVYSHLKKGSVYSQGVFINARPKQFGAVDFRASIIEKIDSEEDMKILEASFKEETGVVAFRGGLSEKQRSLAYRILWKAGLVEPIGLTGETGFAAGTHLSLMIIDAEERTILNPIKKDKPPLEPSLSPPVKRRSPGPVIEDIRIRRGNSMQVFSQGLSVRPGEVEIMARIFDESDFVSYNRKIAPYRIYLSLSGKLVSTIEFNALEERNGRLVLHDTDIDCRGLYYEDWVYRLGTLNLAEGRSIIQIRAEDLYGTARAVEIPLLIENK